ncbi:MAG TPA: Cj0069 family protein [Cyclobacteriaceae bacterium]|nr:Cj0069 family protein [Cyclobacteriaceae bacterium]
MTFRLKPHIAILFHSDHKSGKNRFDRVIQTFSWNNIIADPVAYSDEISSKIRDRLLKFDGVLVWVNPVENNKNRAVLDDMLRDVASNGIFVSAHPDIIDKLGTKEVLYSTRNMSWGSDIHIHNSPEDLRSQLMLLLPAGPRVVKQNRGNGGSGTWLVEMTGGHSWDEPDPMLNVLHASRNSRVKKMQMSEFINSCNMYFTGNGKMINQPYQTRLSEGMIRCYVSQNEVVGFGFQQVNALLKKSDIDVPMQSTPRYYYDEERPEFQDLRDRMNSIWIPQLRRILEIAESDMPVIWDADFLLGSKTEKGEDTFVLCEINASSVFPFPENALAKLVKTTLSSIMNYRVNNNYESGNAG